MSAQAIALDEFETPPADGVVAAAGQYITFACAGQNFGIDIMCMREIRNWTPVTPLPGKMPDVLGVIDIRGRVVPIHDLALRIGCSSEPREQREGQVILVLKVNDHDMGLLVDSVSDIIDVKADDILPVPQIQGSAARFLAGIARHEDNLVAILDEETVRTTAVEFDGAGAELIIDELVGETIDAPTPQEIDAPNDDTEFVFVD